MEGHSFVCAEDDWPLFDMLIIFNTSSIKVKEFQYLNCVQCFSAGFSNFLSVVLTTHWVSEEFNLIYLYLVYSVNF